MKKNFFALFLILGLLVITETQAQRHRYSYRYRPRVWVAPPRVVVPAPSFRLGWGGTRVWVTPPPIIIGRGLGWRHYHGRGGRCNARCHRRYNEGYNDGYEDGRYDERRDNRRYDDYDRRRYDDRRYDNRRYEDYDRYYNKNEDKNRQPETINTDEDIYEEVVDTSIN